MARSDEIQFYGSERHLLRQLGRHRNAFTAEVLKQACFDRGTIEWLDFPVTNQGKDREWMGLEMLDNKDYTRVLEYWKTFWPASGNQMNWDAVGWLKHEGKKQLVLVEAKANGEELISSCQAASPKSINHIRQTFDRVKQDLNALQSSNWMERYYQYANRLTVLWFLQKNGVDTRLLFIYFTGDHIEGKTCPQNAGQWKTFLDQQEQHLGLPAGHALESYIHKIFVKV